MMFSKVYFYTNILHVIACDHTTLKSLFETFFNGWHEVTGNHATND